ncbi:SsrA-binding protein [Candidatus Gracilibacteria bacterium CG17_big_fil_post_rev_8_21_14_2_50_48_13]|nr:MAG: SsrA-binding protein [Candidatus Gracilibacteria bacterium CG17_big_fil_post_rev_8_21_14_2_50_48_13]
MTKHTERIHIYNKKALFDFETVETFEAGIVLQGYEVKSVRLGNVNLKGNFVHIWHDAPWVEGMHIGHYPYASTVEMDAKRKRKLLLKTKEIKKLAQYIHEQGVTAVVLEMYFKGPHAKVKLGIMRGKKQHDKRESIKRRDEERKLQSVLKAFRS